MRVDTCQPHQEKRNKKQREAKIGGCPLPPEQHSASTRSARNTAVAEYRTGARLETHDATHTRGH